MASKHRKFFLACGIALLAGCGQPQDVGPVAQADMLTGTDAMRDFGDFVVYVNALTTDRLTADVAAEYGIARSPGRALLTLSVHRKQEDGAPIAVTGEHSVSAVNLAGQIRNVLLREITEAEAVYYIGELQVTDQETLTYTIDFTPVGETNPLSLRFQRQFFVDR